MFPRSQWLSTEIRNGVDFFKFSKNLLSDAGVTTTRVNDGTLEGLYERSVAVSPLERVRRVHVCRSTRSRRHLHRSGSTDTGFSQQGQG